EMVGRLNHLLREGPLFLPRHSRGGLSQGDGLHLRPAPTVAVAEASRAGVAVVPLPRPLPARHAGVAVPPAATVAALVSARMNRLVREPDALNAPVRFDEREVETGHGGDRRAPADERAGNRYAPPKLPRHLSTLP